MDLYTYDNWKAFKKDLSLSNKDIAEITGTTESNIKTQLSPSKKLPTWARAMLFVWDRQKVEVSGEAIPLPVKDFVFPDDLEPAPVPTMDEVLAKGIAVNLSTVNAAPCGCYFEGIDGGQLFRRAKGCKIKKTSHKFI